MILIRTPSELGAAIRERRIQLDLDQIALAQRAGTSRKWLIEVENGKPRAEIGLILRTLKALGAALAVSDTTADAPPKRGKAKAAAATKAIDIDHVINSLKRRR
jgi:HTH-type transcriptional regulator/antitoxin HipB